MKKRFIVISVCVLLFASVAGIIAGCKDNRLQFYAPDGAPLMSVAELFSEKTALGEREVNYVVTTGTLITGALDGLNPPDIALAPMSLCDKKVLKDGDYVFAGVAVWALLHVLSNTENGGNATTFADIAAAGDIIYAFQPANAGLVLERVIKDGGSQVNVIPEGSDGKTNAKIGFVNIYYLPDVGACRDAILSVTTQVEGAKYALIAEPAATQIDEANDSIVSTFDLNAEWKKLNDGESCPQVGVIIKKTVAEENPEVVVALKEALKTSSAFTRENATRVAEIVKDELGSSDLPAKSAIIKFIEKNGQNAFRYLDEEESKAAVERYHGAN